jgi:hypothetical protein
MNFRPGANGDVSTQQGTLGWPPEAENDPYTPPLSTVSYLTFNPYPQEEGNPNVKRQVG